MKAWQLALGALTVWLALIACSIDEPEFIAERLPVRDRPTVIPAPTTAPAERLDPLTPTGTPLPDVPAETPFLEAPAEELSVTVASPAQDIPEYDRDDWRHWTDEDGDCQDARQEVLIQESAVPVTFKDDDRCRVASGEWIGPYTGQRFSAPEMLDIDHMVPLANAHRSGGWTWNKARKREYANDLTYGNHLIAVQSSANRSKGSKGPDNWKPSDTGYWCQYATDWIKVKNAWQLTVTDTEATALAEMLETCTPQKTLTAIRSQRPGDELLGTPRATAVPEPTIESAVAYDSCEAAEAAGELRVAGSQGTGQGFPQDMVPSARDGDGDGVVCER